MSHHPLQPMPSPNPQIPGSPEFDAHRQNEENPNSDLLRWIGPRLVDALLPVARSLALKFAIRWATIGGTALIALAEKTGFALEVSDAVKVTGAVVLLAGFLVDCLVSLVSQKVRPIPKALPVDDDGQV